MYQGSLIIAGETMCTRQISMHDEPDFLELLRILHEADTVYCHLEMNYPRKDAIPGRPSQFVALRADQSITNELKWMGIDLVSCAFNHSGDWGFDSILGTNEALDKAGIVHAGTGKNLEEAREPAYFESKVGRVAIISMSSGHHPYDSATLTKAPVRGRPGVNPLRVAQKYVITPEQMNNLTDMWKSIGLQIDKPKMQRRATFLAGEEEDIILVAGDLGGGDASTLTFKLGNKPGVQSIPNKWDVEGNLRSIRDARRQADLVIVAHHAAINEGDRTNTPVSFIPSFARECLDTGADVYVGHGWHRHLGIDLYKGKPIFYGVGNFFEQSGFEEKWPASTYEVVGFSPNDLAKLTPADIAETRRSRTRNWKEDVGSVIASLSVEDGKFTQMKLYPFSLGYDFGVDEKFGKGRETGNMMDGRPMLTYGENATRIIDNIKKLSEPYNTKIEYKDGIGVVEIK